MPQNISMQMTPCSTNDPVNKVNKTLTNLLQRRAFHAMEGYDYTSIYNTKITMSVAVSHIGDNVAWSIPGMLASNYCKIEWSYSTSAPPHPTEDLRYVTKYYYIIDKILGEYGYMQIVLKEDVLMSYKDEILANSAIIERQEHYRNGFIYDPVFTVTSKPDILIKELPNGFNRNESKVILTTIGGVQ